jgi:hypothetical protein
VPHLLARSPGGVRFVDALRIAALEGGRTSRRARY